MASLRAIHELVCRLIQMDSETIRLTRRGIQFGGHWRRDGVKRVKERQGRVAWTDANAKSPAAMDLINSSWLRYRSDFKSKRPLQKP